MTLFGREMRTSIDNLLDLSRSLDDASRVAADNLKDAQYKEYNKYYDHPNYTFRLRHVGTNKLVPVMVHASRLIKYTGPEACRPFPWLNEAMEEATPGQKMKVKHSRRKQLATKTKNGMLPRN